MRRIFRFIIGLILFQTVLACNDSDNQERKVWNNTNQMDDVSKKNKLSDSSSGKKTLSYYASPILRKNKINRNTIEPINKNEDKLELEKEVSEIVDLFKKIKKRPEVFSVNPVMDTVLICKGGTRITIPSFAFKYADGSPVRDSVRFEVTEFLSKSDFLLANLSTSSDGAMLETGGMLNIEAFSKNEKVKLRSGDTLLIEIPTETIIPDMELFYGDHDSQGKINWKKESSRLKKKKRKVNPKKEFSNLSIVSSYVDSKGNQFKQDIDKHEWADSARKLEKIDSVEFSFTIDRKGLVKDGPIYRNNKLMKNDKLRFTYLKDFNMSLVGTGRVKETRNLNFGKYYNINLSGINHTYTINEYTLKSIKKKIKETDGNVTVNIKHVFCRRDTLLTYNYWKYKKAIAEFLRKDSTAIKVATASYYAFEAAELDWINVDRFYKSKFPMVPFAVKTVDGKYVDVKVVFRNINSVLPGYNLSGKSDFYTLPEGEAITVVAVMIDKGNTYLAIKDTVVQSGVLDGLEFKEVSIEELKEKMKEVF